MRRAVDRLIKPFFTTRFLQFATVGASGVVVNLSCLWLLKSLGVHINVASALAIEVSLLSNFFINHAWTFRDRRDDAGHIVLQGLRFHLVCLLGATVQFAIFVVMNTVWLYTVLEPGQAAAYHLDARSGIGRWSWHLLVDPPNVGNWVYLSQLLGIAGGTAWNYLLNFYWTWAEGKGRARSSQPTSEPDGLATRSAHGGQEPS